MPRFIRSFTSSIPENGMEEIGSFMFEKTKWFVYGEQRGEYFNMKVFSLTPVKGKAAYWLAFMTNNRKIMNFQDARVMIEKRSKMMDELCKVVNATWEPPREKKVHSPETARFAMGLTSPA